MDSGYSTSAVFSQMGSLGWLGQPGLSVVGLALVGLNIRWAWARSGRPFLSPG